MAVILLFLLMVSPAFTQGLPNLADTTATPKEQRDYRLGAADVLAISVTGMKGFQSGLDIVVSNSGKIHVPYLGVLNVNGVTATQLQAEIARRLREQDLIKEPQVTVRIKNYLGHTIYIIGEVMQPGQFYLRGETYLLDLIALSLGVPTDGTMYLYRRTPAQEEVGENLSESRTLTGETAVTEAIAIDIRGLAEGKRPDLNFQLQGGDVLYVPFNRPKYFYVTGELNSTGSFELPPARQLLVSQAISFAGGPTRTAKMSKGILVRYEQGGARQEVAVDFAAILRGKKPDFPLMPNDIIFIPGSNAKSLGYGLLGIIPSLAIMAF